MRRILPALTIAAALAVAACSGGATAAPSNAATQPPPASQPSASQPPASTAADPCAPSTAAGTVSATMRDFSFSPDTVAATVGDVIVWTNEGDAPHTATLDDHAACDTGTLAGGASGGIVFQAAGTYPFHCAIHPAMKGTVTVSG